MPEDWRRKGAVQLPGSWVVTADTPTWPDQTVKIKVTVKTVTVPFVGMYSVGVQLTRVEETA